MSLFIAYSVPDCGEDLIAHAKELSASSANGGSPADYGYLSSSSYWATDSTGPQWWQADLETADGRYSVMKINSVLTQGSSAGWIINYFLRFSRDGQHWFGHYDGDGLLKVNVLDFRRILDPQIFLLLQLLSGNSDANTIISHNIGPYYARFVRFYPQAYSIKITGRFRVKGCPSK